MRRGYRIIAASRSSARPISRLASRPLFAPNALESSIRPPQAQVGLSRALHSTARNPLTSTPNTRAKEVDDVAGAAGAPGAEAGLSGLPVSMDLLELYRGLVAQGRLKWDDEQVRTVMQVSHSIGKSLFAEAKASTIADRAAASPARDAGRLQSPTRPPSAPDPLRAVPSEADPERGWREEGLVEGKG